MTQGIETKTIEELSASLAEGAITPIEITEFYLDRIAGAAVADRVYAYVSSERALVEAEAATTRQKKGARLSALDGIPISWKDLFDTKNIPTESGCKMLEGRVPSTDAGTVANATALGTICLGKTHLSELAFSGLGLNPMTETTPCVNDLEAVSGGSSSGAAGSVAFGLAPGAIGSDTGGSVRVPSAWNDLVGLKTTKGMLSDEGTQKLCARFDTAGPMGKSVGDTDLMFQALLGQTPKAQEPQTPKRIGVLQSVVLDDLEPEIASSYEAVKSRMGEAGLAMEDLQFPKIARAIELSSCVFNFEAYSDWQAMIAEKGDLMYPPIRKRFEIGREITPEMYESAWSELNEIRTQWQQETEDFDVVFLPTSPILPPKIKRLLEDEPFYTERNLIALRNTRVGNLLGLTVLTLPTDTPSVGMSFMAPAREDLRLLRHGKILEKIIR